jgi:hypothetical protein
MSAPAGDVADRLERLAAHSPAGGVEPDVVWTRGRRRQRVRWAGTAACLVLLAVLGGVAVPEAVQRTQGLVAVTPDDALVLPDVIRPPGEWEPAFSGEPGRLVAVDVGTRGGWWGSQPALWGVSAVTGESRFLDLPDAAAPAFQPPALSTDGRKLAYWFTDEDVEALPGTREPGTSSPHPPAGVAVVDLATGDIERWNAEVPHGLLTEGLVWSGDVLWWNAGVVETVGENRERFRYKTYTWDVRTDERRALEKGTPESDLRLREAGPTPDGLLVDDYRRLHLVQGDHVVRTMRLDSEIGTGYGPPALSPDGARVAAVLTFEADFEPFDGDVTPVVVSSAEGGKTDFTRVGDVKSTAVLGWRSANEVVIEAVRDPFGVHGASVVRTDTSEVAPLVEFRDLQVPAFAADAWTAEVIDAPDAPWAPDPRLLGLAVLVCGTFLVSLWRSIRRRRGHP